jgi:small subunit ribosomal protein S2
LVSVSMKDLLEAGVHFGHQTRRWNPKMKRYIYGSRNGIYILDLHQTVNLFNEASNFLRSVAEDNGSVLFVGTKKQSQDAIRIAAKRSGSFWVNERWLGGMLTNFPTIQGRIQRLKELERWETDGTMERFQKKEQLVLREEKSKLNRFLGGIKDMHRLPDALFIIDVKKEHIAVKEARRLGIPVVAVVDTNCDPDDADFVIPGNDDAIRAIRLMCTRIADVLVDVKGEQWSEAEDEVAEESMDQETAEFLAQAPDAEEPGEEVEEVSSPVRVDEDLAAGGDEEEAAAAEE